MPRLVRALPADATFALVSDRTGSIRASIHDVQFTLVLSTALVVLVVLLFLRSTAATLIAATALPLSLIGTFGGMWVAGFSLDNLSLMALTIGTGFVIDDVIVMIENISAMARTAKSGTDAAYRGASEIGFTVISLTASLLAVFIPLLFMSGIVGRMFREFALTLSIAVVVSAAVSLTLTPMMCARLLGRMRHAKGAEVDAVEKRPWRPVDQRLRAHAASRPCSSDRDANSNGRGSRCHDGSLCGHAQELSSRAGYGSYHFRRQSRFRCVVRGDDTAAATRR